MSSNSLKISTPPSPHSQLASQPQPLPLIVSTQLLFRSLVLVVHNDIMEKGLSLRSQHIIWDLKRALYNYKLSLDDLILNIFGKTKQHLSDKELEKVIKFGDLKLTFDEIDEVFSKLEQANTVSVALMNKLLQHAKDPEPKEQIEGDKGSGSEVKMKALKEVKVYLKANGPYEVIDSFDTNKDGLLNVEELNCLFKKASPTLLAHKDVRVSLIKFFLGKVPSHAMPLKGLLDLFGLKEEPKRVVLDQPYDMQKSRLDKDIKNMYMNKNENEKEKPMKKFKIFTDAPIPAKEVPAKEVPKPPPPPEPKKEMRQPMPEVKDTPNGVVSYDHLSNALHYYRIDQTFADILELVEYYLATGEVFVDSENPKTNKGEFVPAATMFKGLFSLTQMAESVIDRQKHRTGLGLQFEAKDIMQGQVGNCYLLSSLASMVDKFPQHVSNYFLFDINPSGIYVVRLFNDGEWCNIVLDDRFPCVNNKPIYVKPHGKEIWVMLLEKAWAKLHVSYENIGLGTSLEAFVALTGAPCKYMKKEEEKDLSIKDFITDGFKKSAMVTCSGSVKLNELSEKQAEDLGLVGRHAYSVLKIITLTDPKTNKQQQIVRVRNPWGKLEWKGDWSFTSNKWTPQLRQQYNYTKNPNDGSFYMSWEHFCEYFSSMTACYMNPNNVNSSLRLNVDRHEPSYITFQIKKAGRYVFSIYQQSKRKYQHKNTYELSENSMAIAKQLKEGYEYIISGSKSQNNLHVEGDFTEGTHVAKLSVKWNYFSSHECVVTSYGPKSVAFKEANSSLDPQLTAQLISGFSNKNRGDINTYQSIGIPEATRQVLFSMDLGLGYIKVNNPSKKSFKSSIELKESKGIKILQPFKMPLVSDLGPNSGQLFGFAVSSKGYGYSLGEHLQYKQSH